MQLPATADEMQISYHLSMGRVYFCVETGLLYFVDSEFAPEAQIIRTVLGRMNVEPSVTQLYLDKHQLLKAALRIPLSVRQSRVVLVALRLSDIQINLSQNIY
jgi:hypothetical protein